MKRTNKVLISLLLVTVISFLSASVFYAETIFSADGFSYTLLDNSYISIYDWEGGSSDLVIPNSLDQNYVREIRNRCFLGRNDFSTLDLSQADYLNRIGISAFKNSAISGELSIPPQIRTLASGAFENCDGINVLYYNAMSEVVSSQCFYDCDALSEVYLTDGVKHIEMHAFSDCDVLSIVRIPETVIEINDYAFVNCPNLVIYCYTGSYAQQYAEEKGIDYVLIDAPAPTEPPTEAPTETPTEAIIPTEAPTQAPTAEPATEAPTQAPVAILGDVDGDGNVSTIDATLMQRYLASVAYPDYCNFANGDVDGDSVITILDVTYIMRYLASIDVPYPINEPI